jgi:hypothetical protein
MNFIAAKRGANVAVVGTSKTSRRPFNLPQANERFVAALAEVLISGEIGLFVSGVSPHPAAGAAITPPFEARCSERPRPMAEAL